MDLSCLSFIRLHICACLNADNLGKFRNKHFQLASRSITLKSGLIRLKDVYIDVLVLIWSTDHWPMTHQTQLQNIKIDHQWEVLPHSSSLPGLTWITLLVPGARGLDNGSPSWGSEFRLGFWHYYHNSIWEGVHAPCTLHFPVERLGALQGLATVGLRSDPGISGYRTC